MYVYLDVFADDMAFYDAMIVAVTGSLEAKPDHISKRNRGRSQRMHQPVQTIELYSSKSEH